MTSRPRYSGDPLAASGYPKRVLAWCNFTKPLYIAHRGNSASAPENTMAACYDALRLGCRAIEIDVRRAKDGTPVVMHDATIDRTTDGTGTIANLTYEELRQVDAGSWLATHFTGERIPALRDALRLAGEALFIVEVTEVNTDLYDSVIAMFSELNLYRHVTVMGAHAETMNHFQANAPTIRTMFSSATLPAVATLTGYACKGIGVPASVVTASFVTNCHAAGIDVFVYEVKRKMDRDAALAAGVDGYIVEDYAYVADTYTAVAVTLPYTADWSRPFIGTGWVPPHIDRVLTVGSNVLGRTIKNESEATYTYLLDGRYKVPTGNVKISLTLTPKQLSTDATRWAAVQVDQQDGVSATSNPIEAGYDAYQFGLRQNGTMSIEKWPSGAANVQLATGASTEMGVDTAIPLEITFSGNNISFKRTDTNAEITAVDATWRGGMLSYLMHKLAAQFSALTMASP